MSFFEDMLSRQEYLVPMVAASFQYPIHYYGMTSASLLEDLFVDACINFRNSHRREVNISRPERASGGEEASSKGVKGWDYQFQGEHFSHKVGKGISDIALLWDATVTLPDDNRWSYDSTMVYVLSNYKQSTANLTSTAHSKIPVTSILSYRNKRIQSGQGLLIVERKSPLSWKVHEYVVLPEADEMALAMPLEALWEKMIGYWSHGDANCFEVFVTTKPLGDMGQSLVGSEVEIDYLAHPGVYVFSRELLQNIEVKKNNRGVLLPSKTVMELTKTSATDGYFVFMPSWYMTYAENRPADLYLAQRQEFDQMNSASRRR